MAVRQTSMLTYMELQSTGELNKREAEVYNALYSLERATGKEIMRFLGYYNPNMVLPRLTDLMNKGRVRECGFKEHEVGNGRKRKFILWECIV